ncbi:Uu.00g118660.m01.CDS01 [Anthostomella pinea]|uniref:Uu.00g118660.m01.CDS01 n=1 Tax=Anthostomella pinea TaxID=933095 RepID=A0AAI8YH67_9PEZI|nr:Uu.00g118660.m01.CDS01 [Anthostomella pinea]
MAAVNVIVFGATGDVGSHAARTAQQLGANVFLAVRDLAKPVPGLTAEQEKAGRFERVKADLNDAESVGAAVTSTKATRALIYLAHGPDHGMKACIPALKSAGIEFVVFLSSYSVRGRPAETSSDDYISYAHALVELTLAETFGEQNYVAVRPAFFASNILWWSEEIRSGDARIPYPDALFDWIAPADIGRVCGTILAKPEAATGDGDERSVVFLVGPQQMSQRDALAIIGRAIGKDISVTAVSDDEGVALMKKMGVPEGVARSAMNQWSKMNEGSDWYRGSAYEKALRNIEAITERKPLDFAAWADENKQKPGTEWFPKDACEWPDRWVRAGDAVGMTLQATSSTSGLTVVENLTTGRPESHRFANQRELCGFNAEWIVEDLSYDG